MAPNVGLHFYSFLFSLNDCKVYKKKETVLISDFFDYATKVHKIKTLSLEKNSVGLLPSRNKVLGG